MCAEAAVTARIFEKRDDLFELVFRLIDAGDIPEGHLDLLFDSDLGLALADRHEATAEPLLLPHLADHEMPERNKDHGGHHPGQKRAEQMAFHHPAELHSILTQISGELGVDAHGFDPLAPVRQRLLQFRADGLLGDQDLLDLAFAQQSLKLAVGYRLHLAAGHPPLDKHHQQHRRCEIPGIDVRLLVHACSGDQRGGSNGCCIDAYWLFSMCDFPLPFPGDYAGKPAELFGEQIEQVVGRDDSHQVAGGVDDRDAPHTLRPHQLDGLGHAVALLGDHQLRSHDVPDRQCVGIKALGHDSNDDVAIGQNAARHATSVALVDDDEIADMVLPHQLGGCRHRFVTAAEPPLRLRDFTEGHGLLSKQRIEREQRRRDFRLLS